MDNISFQGRNIDIRRAENVLNKIHKNFPAIYPWKINRISDKYNGYNVIGCPLSQEKLQILRDHTVPDFISDYKYAAKIIEGVKQFKVANCKELSEIGYLIAKANNIENCYCANLYKKISDHVTELKDFGHTILLITPQPVKDPKFSHKYYIDNVSIFDSVIPDNKTIVIDAVTGIVDYWKNALSKYAQTSLKGITPNEEIRVCLRKPLITKEKDLNKLKKRYPILNFDTNSDKIKKHYKFRKGMHELEIFKNKFPSRQLNPAPAEKQKQKNIFSKIWTTVQYYI